VYFKALEAASVEGKIAPLAQFIAQAMAQWPPNAEKLRGTRQREP